jgi:Ni,Fe-hydrogenase III large subunit/Ni,Fe-hydrogenase III component G
MTNQIRTLLSNIIGQDSSFVEGLNNELYMLIDKTILSNVIKQMSENGFELISLFCVEDFNSYNFTLFYAFEKSGHEEIVVLYCALNDNHATSIARTFPSACWYEREIRDGFGIEFDDAYDKRRLFLHEIYPKNFHPLLKSFKNQKTNIAELPIQDEYNFKEIRGEGVYQIPVGPVHAGIIEPGHFRFSVIGETIFNLEVRMFYKHRGIEKLAEGKLPIDGVKIAEAISGDETVANAVAYCNCVEKISQIIPSKRALQLRTVFMELERIYSYLGDLSGMCVDVAYPVGAAPFFVLREEIFRLNETLTGSRFLKGIITLGGLVKDVPEYSLKKLLVYLQSFPKRFNNAIELDNTYFSLIDRFETTGIIKQNLLAPLHITGPIARSAGKPIDTRIDHPYGIYRELNVKKRTLPNGDVLSRFRLKATEIIDSVILLQDILRELQDGPISVKCQVKDGYALSLVEAARGQSMHWIYIKNSLISRYKVRTASFCNWQAIEHAVLDNIVPDFPLINKSMNLSYAGTDL